MEKVKRKKETLSESMYYTTSRVRKSTRSSGFKISKVARKNKGVWIWHCIPKGASNKVADALSRQPDMVECIALFVPQGKHWNKLKEELAKDTFITTTQDDILEGRQQHAGFTVANGLLYYKRRLVIPKGTRLITDIIGEFHNSPIRGILGNPRPFKGQQLRYLGGYVKGHH